ncbi:hypothetical protein [Rhodoferax sp.]|uniref:hypothetical protein n=1 Tax=Rhodoferax sp. TaxID=50421 RepID=UPI002ACED628|nr:hypothetical protein [Rhodoferax sp.]MDZ7921691.1 hypothetical protein [Rhodoferax sp.]
MQRDSVGCDAAVDHIADNPALYAQFPRNVGLGLAHTAQAVVDFNRIHVSICRVTNRSKRVIYL